MTSYGDNRRPQWLFELLQDIAALRDWEYSGHDIA
jgi:hypothetical protein